jgi:hypothetical protein
MPELPEVEISPWPMTVSVAPDTLVTVTGISGNSYVIDGFIGLESPTIANEANVEAELPALWASHNLANQI